MQRVGLDRTQMNSQMPGTSYYQNQIAANAAGMRSATQRNSTDANQNLLMAAAANQQSNTAQSQLMGQQAQYQALQEDQYKDSLTALAGEQKAAWKWNTGDAYQQEYDAKMDLKKSLMGAGRKNQWAGLNNLMSAGVDYGYGKGWFGGGGAGAFSKPPTLGEVGLFDNYQGLPGNYGGGAGGGFVDYQGLRGNFNNNAPYHPINSTLGRLGNQ